MSDTENERPSDHTPEIPPHAADDAAAAQPVAPPLPPTTPAAAPPVHPGAPTGAWQPPQAMRPTAYPPHPTQMPPYAPRPQAYSGQPAPGPQYAAAYGRPPGQPDAHPTQPTVPFDRAATGAVATAPAEPRKQGAGARAAGLIVAAAIVGGAAGLGGAYAGVNLFAPAGGSPLAGPSTVTVNNSDEVNQTTAIAAKVLPSVVTIEATGSDGAGTGSGVVLTADGYVVTNTHVVTLDGRTADAAIRVTTSGGRVYDAEVVGTDPTYDLAVIKLVDAEDLTPAEFADSANLNVGDQTIAVGAPLGLSNTVTTGIVSALNRSIQIASAAAPDSSDAPAPDSEAPEGGQSPFQFDFGDGLNPSGMPTESISIAVIQTDAAINPGNSGGALVDEEGRLIGINVAIASAGGSSSPSGSIGVGFSIPSNIVERITEEIIETGVATHGLLGASVRDAAAVESSTITGAYIAEVVADGAAVAAGLQEGDIVTAFNGVPVTDATDLTAQVRAAAADSEASVTFVRDGKTRTVEVTLGELAP